MMDESGEVGWTPIYLVIVLVIAAILLFAIIKPMFQEGARYAEYGLSLIAPFFL